MKIQYLLNPFCGDRHDYRNSESPIPSAHPIAAVSVPRRHKIPKDAPIFSESNKPVGIVNFLPYEAENDKELLAQHRRFQIYPLGEIAKKGVRHIPYNSDKKDFLEKTGRDAFEVFQYTYKLPGEEKEYVVVWDYNVGLVRMTPFFKSCKHSKTIPAKALRENPGLKDISYSITGGALVCQGYWMPYQAARAIAATFCYDIRWALTPVFGNDFPSVCLKPDDPRFAKFVIDPTVVRYCTEETTKFRELGPAYQVHRPVVTTPAPSPPSREAPKPHHSEQALLKIQVVKQQRARQPVDTESGYGTDTERSDRYLFSPEVSPRTRFTPINRPQSPLSPHIAGSSFVSSPVSSNSNSSSSMRAPLGLLTPTSAPYEYSGESLRAKRSHSKVAFHEHLPADDAVARPPTAATVDSAHGSEVSIGDDGRSHVDMDAAEMLLSLRTADSSMPPSKRTRRDSWCSK